MRPADPAPSPSPAARLLASGQLGARLVAAARAAAAVHMGHQAMPAETVAPSRLTPAAAEPRP
ncbi:MAG: hypothetical protein WD749_03360 [Phycisphaerales bacterium]